MKIFSRFFFFDIFLIFAQNIDFGYTLNEAVLTSIHNLCFGAKIRKYVYPCKPHFFYIKVGFSGVFLSRTCFPDDYENMPMQYTEIFSAVKIENCIRNKMIFL